MMGLVLSVLWVRLNLAYHLGWDLDFYLAVGTIPVAALAAALVSIPAGMLPARRISRLPSSRPCARSDGLPVRSACPHPEPRTAERGDAEESAESLLTTLRGLFPQRGSVPPDHHRFRSPSPMCDPRGQCQVGSRSGPSF